MEHIYHIRFEYHEKGKSIHALAKETGHDRKTIKKYVKQENFSLQKPVKRKRKRKTDAYREQVRQWLIEDQKAPRMQRHTAKRVYCRLQEKEQKAQRAICVSERAVRYLVAELKQELGQQKMASLPLLHPAGEAQVDFGHTVFYEAGVEYEGSHLALTLPHSDAKFVQLFKGQNFECLAQGLRDIFGHIGGVPHVIRFDNMSTAVKKIKEQGKREITENFRRLQCHYGFESNFCNPAAGHEKGSVENYVGYSRRNYFVPVPQIADLESYNRELLKRCEKDLEREHYKLQKPVRQLFEEDKASMKTLPQHDFEVGRYVLVKTNAYGMAKWQSNSYSTAGDYNGREVTLKLGAHKVAIMDERMKTLVTHKRLYGRNKESMLWEPYLSVLAKRPTALKYSGFFQGLREPVRSFLDGCDLEGKKTVLEAVLKASLKSGWERSIFALSEAVEMEPGDADGLVSAYAFVLNKPVQPPKNKVPEHLPELSEYTLDLNAYARLMGEVDHETATDS